MFLIVLQMMMIITRCLKAATTFQGLLKLERAAKIVSEQEENFAEITITSVVV